MKHLISILFLALFFSQTAASEAVLTFEEAVYIAIERNPRIAAARNDAEIASNNAHAGNAGLFPKLDFTGSANYNRTDPPSGIETETSSTSARLGATYTLFNGLGNIYRYKRLKSEERLGELNARERIENIIIHVSKAYYGAAEAFETLLVSRELLDISRERLERVKSRSDFGQGGSVDVLNAKVNYNTDTVTVVRSEFAWEEATRNLNSLLNRNLGSKYKVDSNVKFANLEPLSQLREKALKQNSSYQIASESVKRAAFGQKVTRSAFMPRLDLSTSYGWEEYSNEGLNLDFNDPTSNWGVYATLSFNIFNGFQRRIDSKNAALEVRSRKMLEEQARLDMDRELINAYKSYSNSRAILDLEKNNLESARINFQHTSKLYDLGQVTSTQFREAQLNLTRAKTSVISATYQAKLDEIELFRITGNLVNEI
ncbi:MAG: TolC family protein [Candidatus Krumholzibacteriota bacterium]|nr:TolC family protein [Candidatus Krumholzibacteriota bacterium]